MKRREQPPPETPLIDRDEVRRLIAELDAARVAVGNIHQHAAQYRLLELHYNAGRLICIELCPNAPWEPAPPARTAEQIEALADLFLERVAPGFSVETSPYYADWRRRRAESP